MTFPELCEALEREVGHVAVFDKRYPNLGAQSADQAVLILWAHDGGFDVGGVERGEFSLVRRFATEAAACEYLFDSVKQQATITPESETAREESKRTTDAFTATLLKEFGTKNE